MHLTSYKYILICSLLIMLTTTACSIMPNTSQEVNLEEYALNDALDTCKTAASEITDGANGSSNPKWKSYFEMCMSSKGYAQEDYEHLWY